MPISYHHSLDLSKLAHVLQDSITTEQKDFPLHSPIVVVPNPNIERWLKINLPKYAPANISLNVRYIFLEKLFEDIFLEGAPSSLKILNQSEIEKLIFKYLWKHKSEKFLSFLENYLESALRTFYLSKKLGIYFKDYELNRSFWIADWAKEKGISIPVFSKSESSKLNEVSEYYNFQKRIYSDLFLNTEDQIFTFGQFLIRQTQYNEKNKFNHKSIHLFCLANLSDTYLNTLAQLSNISKLNIHFYQFHTGNSDLGTISNVKSPVRWSYPQVMMSDSLTKLTSNSSNSKENNLDPKFPIGLTALHNLLQGKSIDSNLEKYQNYAATADASIRFWNAPSTYRELESVANDILYKMNLAKTNKEELSLLDFAVLVTDIKSYRSAIDWVFDGGVLIETNSPQNKKILREKIPYSLVDLKASEASPLFRFLRDFWQICKPSGFLYSEFLQLIRNPILQNSDLDGERLAAIESCFEMLGVAYQDTFLTRTNDPSQISEGIKRAVLSTLLSEKFDWEKLNLFPFEIEEDDIVILIADIWDHIYEAQREIVNILQFKEWSEGNLNKIKEILITLLNFDKNDLEYKREFNYFIEQLLCWENINLEMEDGLDILKMITNQSFDGINVKKGDYLTGGITISLLQPMRPLPFKHVYIIGLGEGKFPGSGDKSQLNLRKEIPEVWDLDRKQIQESLFWESLFSATMSITLSYVGKNTKEDKEFEPCSSYLELMQAFGFEKAIQIPLVAYSNEYTHESDTLKLGLVSYDYSRIWFNDEKANPETLKQFQNPDSLEVSIKKEKSKRINIFELVQYLKDPLDTYLRKNLGMYISGDELNDKEELFSLDHLNRSIIIKEIFNHVFPTLVTKNTIWNRGRIEEILDSIVYTEIRKAKFPNGAFTELERSRILDHFENLFATFVDWQNLLSGATYYPKVSFGNTGLNPSLCRQYPYIDIKGNTNVTLSGEWEHFFIKEERVYLIYTKSLYSNPKKIGDFGFPKDYFGNRIELFLTYLCFKKNNLTLSILTTNQKNDDNSLKPEIVFSYPISEKLQSNYILDLVDHFLSNDPIFFSRFAYQNFYIDKIMKNSALIDLSSLENDWLNYHTEEKDFIAHHLTPITKLYPKIDKYIQNPSLSFANRFYLPLGEQKLKNSKEDTL
ncbi:MAG: exodeoxyribonuclease V subunit gamma [Leptospira sp.]|nr:exodeoxyribonuclease V subunit gamma [Leptospira sp.]